MGVACDLVFEIEWREGKGLFPSLHYLLKPGSKEWTLCLLASLNQYGDGLVLSKSDFSLWTMLKLDFIIIFKKYSSSCKYHLHYSTFWQLLPKLMRMTNPLLCWNTSIYNEVKRQKSFLWDNSKCQGHGIVHSVKYP